MKRTVITTRLVMAAALLQICAAANGVYGAEGAQPAAAASGSAVQKAAGAESAAEPGTADAGQAKAAEGIKDEDGMMVDLKVPLMSPAFAKTPIAEVNGDKIPMEEFTEVVSSMHQAMSESKEGASSSISMNVLLRRLINTRLFVQEAKNIELDQLPEIKEAIEQGNKKILREMLYMRIAATAKPDEKEVEKNYQAMTHEVKLKTVAFYKEQYAKDFIKKVRAGGNFQELVEQAVQEKKGERVSESDDFVKLAQLHPQAAAAVSATAVKGVTSPVLVSKHYMVFNVLDKRTVEMPGQRDEARVNLLGKAQIDAYNAYQAKLIKKYMKQNTKLIKSIDFEAKKPGFEALKKDKRVLVTCEGEKPITVADLAQAVEAKFFHGVALAITEKKVNKEKDGLLNQMMSRIAFDKDAVDQHLDKSDEYLKKSGELTRSILFGVFIEKVVKPDVKGTDAELQEYYKAHAEEYTAPEQLTVDGIVFQKSPDAKAAAAKLRQGMDLTWLRANAEGQVAKNAANLIELREGPVAVSSLPPAAQKVMVGAKLGEYRIYESPEGYQYVLHVAEVVPKQVRPYMAVRDDIAKVIYDQKFSNVIDDWGDKLGKAATIKTYLQLKQKTPTP